MKKYYILILITIRCVSAQPLTVGLIQISPGVADGYTLFSPNFCPDNDCPTYLINNCGEIVNQWPTASIPGLSSKLLPNGLLLRPYFIQHPFMNSGGCGGGIQLWDFNGNLIWDYVVADNHSTPHHEVTPLPNGNLLVLIWNYRDSVEAVLKGRISSTVTGAGIWSDKIIEIRPIFPDSAELIWQWDSWDHIVQNVSPILPSYGNPSSHPELFDINYLGLSNGGADWLHTNAIDYNPDLDQIAISSRHLQEIYIIDHSTTSYQSASHSGGSSSKGGDILYRWGNPEAYGKTTDQAHRFFGQHNVHWIPDSLNDHGKLMIFNNGSSRTPVEYSSVEIINPPVDSIGNYFLNQNGTFGPDSAEWSYTAPNPPDFHAQYISGAQRLKNGNTLICDGTHGTFFEINSAKQIVWKYVCAMTFDGLLSQGQNPNPFTVDGTNNWVFRALKYDPNFPAFSGRILNGSGHVELNPTPFPYCNVIGISEIDLKEKLIAYPNPSEGLVHIKDVDAADQISVINIMGATQVMSAQNITAEGCTIDISTLPAGTYQLQIFGNKKFRNCVIVKMD